VLFSQARWLTAVVGALREITGTCLVIEVTVVR